ncbi:hypothetical protein BD560DRAFT_384884 [Blakeslea trispora]|nr:hypothetical protein BD560DRAFT_384884 [Blakeslea trispora]
MFPLYFEQHPSSLRCRRTEPQQFSVNDYMQLELLLAQEQAQRQQAAFRKAYEKQQMEQRRLDRAMYKLQVMAEIQRRREEEELAIQAYYAAKRQQHQKWLMQQQKEQEYLRRKQQQMEEEAYYQAMIESQLKEQYELNGMMQKSTRSVQTVPAKTYYREESDDESDNDTEDKLKALVKIIFGHQEEDDDDNEEEDDEEEMQDEDEEHEHQTMTVDELVNYVSKKVQELDDSKQEDMIEEDKNSDMEEDAMDFEFVRDDKSDSMDEESEQEDDEDMPVLVKSTDAVKDLVHSLIEESDDDNNSDEESVPQDPVKFAKLDALNRIEKELEEVRQKHESHILHGTLSFPELAQGDRAISPETLSASSAENKEFLGYEDQIMKLLLRLDTIESDGDEEIRNKRKTLVKQAEDMLHTLDEFKQKEWERVSCSSQSDHSEDDF